MNEIKEEIVCSNDIVNRNSIHFPFKPLPPGLVLMLLHFVWLENNTTLQAALSEARSKLAALENALSRSDEELQEAQSQLERMQVRAQPRVLRWYTSCTILGALGR